MYPRLTCAVGLELPCPRSADTTVGLAVGPELLQTWQRQYPDWFKRNTKLDTPEELTKHIHGLARKPALNNTKLPCVCLKPPGIKLRRHEEGCLHGFLIKCHKSEHGKRAN
eukprot:jgi/Tetstr1/455763/TSEL_042560.t1